MPRGNLIVMTGASGVGKGTIRARLLEYIRPLYYSISMTTRPPRVGERNGVDYYFVSRPEFEAKIAQNGFLEYAQYVEDYYGTPASRWKGLWPRAPTCCWRSKSRGPYRWPGRSPEAILVFVVPPSLSELRRRLLLRGTDSLEKIHQRLKRAEEELREAHHFDYVVVNDQLDRAVSDFSSIIQAERLKTKRMEDALRRSLGREPALEAELDLLERKLAGNGPN